MTSPWSAPTSWRRLIDALQESDARTVANPREADLLLANGLLPKVIDVRAAVLPAVSALVEKSRRAAV